MGSMCPACGFESPTGAAYCDFCKEPFRKKETAQGTAAGGATARHPAEAPPPASPLKIPPSPLPQIRYRIAPGEAPGGRMPRPDELPKEVQAKLDAALALGMGEEKVPALPRWFRVLAWTLLGVWFVSGMILAGIMVARYSARGTGPAPAVQR